ncbi:STAS domain-containing protein [Streptomyces chartreusis]
MPDPSVEMTAYGRCVVARVSGDLDYRTDGEVQARFKELTARDERFMVLDLSGVTFCDSAGLSVLLRVWRQADAGGAVLVLADVPASLRQILEMTGVDQVVRVFGTASEAQAVFGT